MLLSEMRFKQGDYQNHVKFYILLRPTAVQTTRVENVCTVVDNLKSLRNSALLAFEETLNIKYTKDFYLVGFCHDHHTQK